MAASLRELTRLVDAGGASASLGRWMDTPSIVDPSMGLYERALTWASLRALHSSHGFCLDEFLRGCEFARNESPDLPQSARTSSQTYIRSSPAQLVVHTSYALTWCETVNGRRSRSLFTHHITEICGGSLRRQVLPKTTSLSSRPYYAERAQLVRITDTRASRYAFMRFNLSHCMTFNTIGTLCTSHPSCRRAGGRLRVPWATPRRSRASTWAGRSLTSSGVYLQSTTIDEGWNRRRLGAAVD